MTPEPTLLPDLDRSDAEVAVLGEWYVGGPERQSAVVDAALNAWKVYGWPDGLLSHHCLASLDGTTVAHYSQWASTETLQAFRDSGRPSTNRCGVIDYRVDRGRIRTQRAPGCIVLIRFDLDDRATGDRLLEALSAFGRSRAPTSGLMGSYFHFSDDGRHALNYAAWEDEESHERSLDTPDLRARLKLIDSFVGVRFRGFTRYALAGGLVHPTHVAA